MGAFPAKSVVWSAVVQDATSGHAPADGSVSVAPEGFSGEVAAVPVAGPRSVSETVAVDDSAGGCVMLDVVLTAGSPVVPTTAPLTDSPRSAEPSVAALQPLASTASATAAIPHHCRGVMAIFLSRCRLLVIGAATGARGTPAGRRTFRLT
jgi:hypothetical protein